MVQSISGKFILCPLADWPEVKGSLACGMYHAPPARPPEGLGESWRIWGGTNRLQAGLGRAEGAGDSYAALHRLPGPTIAEAQTGVAALQKRAHCTTPWGLEIWG